MFGGDLVRDRSSCEILFARSVIDWFVAKHKRRRSRRFSLRPVRITPTLPLLTLAAVTGLTVTTTGASANRYRCISVKGTWSLTDLTANDGPVTVGYAHSDYSVAQIKEFLESSNSIDQGDKRAQEFANRLVRVVGTLNEVRESLNDGQPITTKLNWLIGIGDAVNLFAFNENAGPLTTGAIVDLVGTMWVSDKA